MSATQGKAVLQPLFAVAFAASAGGLAALSQILAPLPPDFAAAIVVVQHLSPNHVSFMADILGRRTRLKVKQAETGDPLTPGIIYIAPPNLHLLIEADGKLTLSQAEPLHFLRPSADLLFESLAKSYKEHAIAVVLTGTGTDGANGIRIVKSMGGIVIAQDEATSEFFGMPGTAIQTGMVDYILPLNKIAESLENLIETGTVK